MTPRVSIITITHQGRDQYLREMIACVKKQTYTDWELIVIDNGSYDDTASLIEAEAAADERFVYLKNEHDPGISAARNQGLKAARGEFLAVLDSDDLWADKNKLKKQIAYLETHPNCAVVGTSVIVIDENGKELKRYQNPEQPEQIKKHILYKNPLAHSSVLMRKGAALHVGGYDENLPYLEDYDLWLRMGALWQLANLPGFMTKYRQHQSNVTKKSILGMLKLNISLLRKYHAYYPNVILAYARRTVRAVGGWIRIRIKRK